MSRRYLALWLPHFATDRLHRGPEPFVTLLQKHGVPYVAAANASASRLGIIPGIALTDARALYPALATQQANPLREHRSLVRLANWCERYSPSIALDSSDGMMIDITGCDHLFGGETAMLNEIATRLQGFGYTTLAAIAPTPGAAWALSHYADKGMIVNDPTDLPNLLSPLPLAALRLKSESIIRLTQVGLRQIGDLLTIPRAPLARRFGSQVGQRLAQALGQKTEAIALRHPPAPYRLRLDWTEPLHRTEDLITAAEYLLGQLCKQLEKDKRGVRQLTVTCHGTDSHTHDASLRTSAPSRRVIQLLRLLEANLETCDLGFGIETMILSVACTEKLQTTTSSLWLQKAAMAEGTATLIDQLSHRLAEQHVSWPHPIASYLPERSIAFPSALQHDPASIDKTETSNYNHKANSLRPLRLLPKPEPVKVTALMPDHPPAAFYWGKMQSRVSQGCGPERITPEWWRAPLANSPNINLDDHTRDYYLVQHSTGKRFWLYRQGLYDRSQWHPPEPNNITSPTWFIHGLMA